MIATNRIDTRTPIEKILGSLDGLVESGLNQWQALCPAHDDDKPSLGIHLKPDGKVLLNCLAGCRTASVCHSMGYTLAELFPQPDPIEEPRTGKKSRRQSEQKPSSPEERLEFVPHWNPAIFKGLVQAFPGTTAESYKVCGAQLAKYPKDSREPRYVVALPSFATDPENAIGFTLAAVDGTRLSTKTGSQKRINIGRSGLLNSHAVQILAGTPETVELVWKVEGVSDLLALQAAIPDHLRDTHLVTTNAGGCAQSGLAKEVADRFKGVHVAVIHDADEPGQNGVANWTGPLVGVAASVRNVQLPYPVEKSHGKDLRDWLNEGHSYHDLLRLYQSTPEATADTVPAVKPKVPEGAVDIGDGEIVLFELDDPKRLAAEFIKRRMHSSGRTTICRHRDEWFEFDGVCYRRLTNEQITSDIVRFVQSEFEADAAEKLAAYLEADEKSEGGAPKVQKLSRNLTANVLQHLTSLTSLPKGITEHDWIENKPDGFDSSDIAIFENGILNLRQYCLGGDNYLTPPTPYFFATDALPFPFLPAAGQPEQWLRFLDQIWPGDPQSIECLQQWFGLLITRNTSFQKMLLLIGPRRSGKGTICRVIKELVGESNCAGPTFSALASNFGLQSLLGKTLGIFGDTRISNRTDTAVAVERLLQITGEDAVVVDRKGQAAIHTTLPVRFVMASNELPKLVDA